MKINLGSGRDILDDYINIDIAPYDIDADNFIQADAINYVQNLPANSVEEIRSKHFFEHLTRTQMCTLMYYGHKALQENGIFNMIVPIFDINAWNLWNIKDLYQKQEYATRFFCGGSEPDTWGDLHKFIYDKELLKYIFESYGFQDITIKDREIAYYDHKFISSQIIGRKQEIEHQFYQYNVLGELQHLFANVVLDGAEDRYYIYQIENVGKTSFSTNGHLYRQWFTLRGGSEEDRPMAFYDSGYYSCATDIDLIKSVELVPFSHKWSVRGTLDIDFSSLGVGFFNSGFVSNEIEFIRGKALS